MIDELLLVMARALLRTCSVGTAHGILRRLGALVPERATIGELRRASSRYGARGSCLSRSLALAARNPRADVVIGVDLLEESRLKAHAWVELAGAPLEPGDPQGREISRLRGHVNTPHGIGTEA